MGLTSLSYTAYWIWACCTVLSVKTLQRRSVIGGQRCSTPETAAEVVTAPIQGLYKQSKQAKQSDKTRLSTHLQSATQKPVDLKADYSS